MGLRKNPNPCPPGVTKPEPPPPPPSTKVVTENDVLKWAREHNYFLVSKELVDQFHQEQKQRMVEAVTTLLEIQKATGVWCDKATKDILI